MDKTFYQTTCTTEGDRGSGEPRSCCGGGLFQAVRVVAGGSAGVGVGDWHGLVRLDALHVFVGKRLITHLPSARSITDYEALLPWNLDRAKIMLATVEAGD